MSCHLNELTTRSLTICVDFDGTCVKHAYPEVGEDIGAAPVLKRLCYAGHKIVLFTMRDSDELKDAVAWFEKNRIPLYGVNVNPDQRDWTRSPKAWGKIYIDDCGWGIPLKSDGAGQRSYVDWAEINKVLIRMGI